MNIIKKITTALLVISLSACVTAPQQLPVDNSKIIAKRTDEITFVSVPSKDKVVYAEFINNSGTDFDIESKVIHQIKASGYSVTNDIKAAHFLLQVKVQRIGTIDDDVLKELNTSHFGNSLNALSLPKEANQSPTVDDEVENNNYAIITDIKLYELISPTYDQQQADAGTDSIDHWYNGNSIDWERFYSRVITSATDVPNSFEQLQTPMQNATANAIGGIF